MDHEVSLNGLFSRLPVFVQNVSFIFAVQAVVVLSGMLANIILARQLGPEGQGKYVLCVLVGVLLFRFSSLNIGVAATYFVGRKIFPADQVARNSAAIALCVGAAAAAGYYFFMPFVSSVFLKNLTGPELAAAFLLFPFGLLSSYLLGISRGLQYIKRASFVDVIETLSKLLFLSLALLLLKAGVLGAVYAAAAAAFCGMIYSFMILPGYARTLSPRFEPAVIRDLSLFGIKGHLGGIVQFFNYRLDLLLVNFFLTPAAVGVYSIATLLGELVWYIPSAVSSVLLPKTAGSTTEEADAFAPVISRITVAATLVFALLLALLAGPAIGFFFGASYSAALGPLLILLPGIVAFSVAKIITSYLAGRGYPAYATYIAGFSLVFTALLDILLIPRYGIIGAAAATSLSYMISTLFFLRVVRRISGTPRSGYMLIKRSDLFLLAGMIKKLKTGAA